MPLEKASAAIDFLSISASETCDMFEEGFWSRPILRVDDSDVAIVLTSLEVGSPIRRVEHWLARAGYSDNLSDAGRGESFELAVRNRLSETIRTNSILSNSQCCPDSIKRDDDTGEQIDLLIKLNDTIIVGEVKCWIGPTEPTERYNYLKKLMGAAEQASRKLKWVRANLDAVGKYLDVCACKNFVPIVVTNLSYGSSMEIDGVLVTDFHFLRLFLAGGKYTSGMAFDRDKRTAVQFEEDLYATELEAENNFVSALSSPRPLKRYLDALEWFESKFPKSDGGNLRVMSCNFSKSISSLDDGEILQLLSQ
jgi:hypothetical protein